MTTQREAVEKQQVDIEAMSTEDKAALIALLTSDKEAVKLATEEHSVAFKVGAYRNPQPKPDGKRAKQESIMLSVQSELMSEYLVVQELMEQADKDYTAFLAKSVNKVNLACEEKGIDSFQVQWGMVDGTQALYKATRGAHVWNPQTYMVNGETPTSAPASSLVRASKALARPATLAELKEKAGLTTNAKIGSIMGDYFTKVEKVSRPTPK